MSTESTDIVDYAMPLMNIERLAKEVHQACLGNKFGSAEDLAVLLVTEVRLLQGVLAVMREGQQ